MAKVQKPAPLRTGFKLSKKETFPLPGHGSAAHAETEFRCRGERLAGLHKRRREIVVVRRVGVKLRFKRKAAAVGDRPIGRLAGIAGSGEPAAAVKLHAGQVGINLQHTAARLLLHAGAKAECAPGLAQAVVVVVADALMRTFLACTFCILTVVL